MAKDNNINSASDNFKRTSKRLYFIVALEALSAFTLALIIYYGLVEDIWYQPYIDHITSQWEAGPITEIRAIKGDEYCDEDTMLSYLKSEVGMDDHKTDSNQDFGFKHGTFEIVG